MLVDFPQLLAAMAAMFVAALAIDFARDFIFKTHALATTRFSDKLLVDLLFFVMLPGTIYAWFYPLVPFSGLRAGLFLALAMFLLAVAPTFAVFQLQTPDHKPVVLGHLFWVAAKYLLVYGVMTLIYQP